MPVNSIQFGAACRTLAGAARRCGLAAPSFRSPPRLAGVERTVRHRGRGPAVVAVTYAGRALPAVLADLVEGVVVANRLEGAAAIRARSALWEALSAELPGGVGSSAA